MSSSCSDKRLNNKKPSYIKASVFFPSNSFKTCWNIGETWHHYNLKITSLLQKDHDWIHQIWRIILGLTDYIWDKTLKCVLTSHRYCCNIKIWWLCCAALILAHSPWLHFLLNIRTPPWLPKEKYTLLSTTTTTCESSHPMHVHTRFQLNTYTCISFSLCMSAYLIILSHLIQGFYLPTIKKKQLQISDLVSWNPFLLLGHKTHQIAWSWIKFSRIWTLSYDTKDCRSPAQEPEAEHYVLKNTR